MDSDPDKAREIIMLCLGGAGVKIGHRVWEQYNWEHGLLPNGSFACPDRLAETNDNIKSIYKRSADGIYSPRVLFWDFDSRSIDGLRVGHFGKLYDPNFMVAGKDDAGGSYSRAYHTLSRIHYETLSDKIRKLVEPCDNLQGFQIVRSLGGGTGTGIGSMLLEKLSMHYGKKLNMEFNVFPSPRLNSGITDPYNVLLSQTAAMQYVDVAFLFENDALYNCCIDKLDISEPTYSHTNKLIAKVMTGITGPFRFTGQGSMSMNEFQTNLVPLPRLHFPIPAFSPIVPGEKYVFGRGNRDISSLIAEIFDAKNQFVVNNRKSKSKFVALQLLFRGEISPNDVNRYTLGMKSRLPFVSWLGGGIKSTICDRPPFTTPNADFAPSDVGVTGLINTTGVSGCWRRIIMNYDSMFHHKAFLHHYISEGTTEAEFLDARENMAHLLDDYRQVEIETWSDWKTKEEECRARRMQSERSKLSPTVIGIKSPGKLVTKSTVSIRSRRPTSKISVVRVKSTKTTPSVAVQVEPKNTTPSLPQVAAKKTVSILEPPSKAESRIII